MSYIILNGISSQSLEGFLIQSLPPISKPAMRTQVEEIDGKDGDIATNLGYSAYDKEFSIGLYGNFDIDEIIGFFNSEGTVVFSNENDKIYQYRIVEQIDFERLIRFRTAQVKMRVQPFKFSLAETPLTFYPTTATDEGENIRLRPTTEGEKLRSFSLYGNSQQNEPTPANPTDIANVTGNMNVRFSHSLYTDKTVNLDVELCKIGNYQDAIYNDNGWVKYTAVSHFEVDTSEITIQEMRNITYAKFPIPQNALCYGNYKPIPCLCTHAQYADASPEGWNSVNGIDKIFCQGSQDEFWIGFAAGTSLSTIQTALTNCTIYYVLLDKLNVPLQSTTLKNQLDALLNVSLYDVYTDIRVTNAPVSPILQATAVNQIYMVRNIGNIYSRPKLTLRGTGTIYVQANGKLIFTVEMDGEITIDGAKMEAYSGDTLKNRNVRGSYDNFMLNVGKNRIEFSGNLTDVEIANYSRWL